MRDPSLARATRDYHRHGGPPMDDWYRYRQDLLNPEVCRCWSCHCEIAEPQTRYQRVVKLSTQGMMIAVVCTAVYCMAVGVRRTNNGDL